MLDRTPVLRHLLGRGAWYAATLLVAVAVNFLLPRLGDASPVDVIMSRAASGLDSRAAQEREEGYLKEFGLVALDEAGEILRTADGAPVPASLMSQFVDYLSMTLRGDLGTSILQHPKPVVEIIANALPWTLALQLPTIGLGWILGNALGALAAYRRGWFDKAMYPLALLASAVPAFCFGVLLVYLFAIQLEWLPAVGAYDESLTPRLSWDFLSSAAYFYVLPFTSVFVVWVGGQAIGMRSMCIYQLGTDYVRYAQLLGISEWRILLYVFRNAMLPQLTGLGVALGAMVGGAVVTEIIFGYPGLGLAILTAIQGNDYPLITGCTLLITVSVLLANFSVDMLVGFLDPRIRRSQRQGG